MLQNLKLTVSNDQILPKPLKLLSHDENTTITVISSNCTDDIESKQKIKVFHKAFNVKLKKYKTMQTNFTNACHHLITSFKSMKNVQDGNYLDPLEIKNHPGFEELETTIKNIIEKHFKIQFPKLTASMIKDHQRYVSNLMTPTISLIIDSASKYSKIYSAVKEVYEYVSKIISKMFDINMKYHFLLTMLIQPDEFYDLNDAREYLVQNMFDKEQMHEQLDFDNCYESLKSKLTIIINEFNEVLEHKKYDEFNDEKFLKMNLEIKNAEKSFSKNEMFKNIESEYCKQIKSLIEELAFRNRELINVQDCLKSLTKEKYDLISEIEKIEVHKEEGFLSLQKEIEKEQAKNKHLITIIEKHYTEKLDTDF